MILVTFLLPFFLFSPILFICVSLSLSFFLLSYSLLPQFCVFFSPCHVFNLFFTNVNLLICFSAYVPHPVFIFSCPILCPCYMLRTFYSVIFSLVLDLFLHLFMFVRVPLFISASRFISSVLALLTKLYAAIYWLHTSWHSLPLKMHYCVTELNRYCPGLFVHNIVLELEF